MKLHVPHVALCNISRHHIVLTIWGRTLFFWRSAKARRGDQ